VALIIGIGLYVFFSFFDLEVATEKWRWLPVFKVLFIASLLFLGVEGDTGNKSWIRFSWFPIGIQPAELVKLTFVLLLAKQITTLQEGGISRTSAILQLSGHTFFMCALIRRFPVTRAWSSSIFHFSRDGIHGRVKLRWFVGAFAAAGGLITLFWEIFSDNFPIISKAVFGCA
jgi:rod shape determining protein RodA